MSAEESAKQYEQIAALPAADLGAIIKSSKNRMIAYSIFALVSMIVTNASVAYAALETPFPAWLIVSVSVIGNLSVPFAALAVANARSANAKS
jgi:ABC-type glycerol-3-phosphate transport system permease component